MFFDLTFIWHYPSMILSWLPFLPIFLICFFFYLFRDDFIDFWFRFFLNWLGSFHLNHFRLLRRQFRKITLWIRLLSFDVRCIVIFHPTNVSWLSRLGFIVWPSRHPSNFGHRVNVFDILTCSPILNKPYLPYLFSYYKSGTKCSLFLARARSLYLFYLLI